MVVVFRFLRGTCSYEMALQSSRLLADTQRRVCGKTGAFFLRYCRALFESVNAHGPLSRELSPSKQHALICVSARPPTTTTPRKTKLPSLSPSHHTRSSGASRHLQRATRACPTQRDPCIVPGSPPSPCSAAGAPLIAPPPLLVLVVAALSSAAIHVTPRPIIATPPGGGQQQGGPWIEEEGDTRWRIVRSWGQEIPG